MARCISMPGQARHNKIGGEQRRDQIGAMSARSAVHAGVLETIRIPLGMDFETETMADGGAASAHRPQLATEAGTAAVSVLLRRRGEVDVSE